MVLTGTYRDHVFTVIDAAEAQHHAIPMQVYAISHSDGNLSTISPTGEEILVELRESRVVPAGATHHLERGVFHETPIPAEDFVATLIVMGNMTSTPPAALEEGAYPARVHRRSAVTDRQRESMLADLLARVEHAADQP